MCKEMRITYLLLIGILISLTAATASSKNDYSSKKSTAKPAINVAKTTTTPANSTATSLARRSPKAVQNSKPGESRGKRTLYDFNNPAFIYPQIAARRAGYESESRSTFSGQSGYFNGQNAIAQFPSDYNLNYSPYPQYLEAPEPIIEIIIKDANETVPEANAQPIVGKSKKKKEKVHVFYVNYKKDQNNKLHLESPIASLNNDETEEEEEEEEENTVHYTVTPLPPVKSTTLRTIIHPDSEKYHSNSGIHVTFGSEDNHQTGHILEEHDAESIQRQVVAVPVPHAGIKSQFQVNARNDFNGEARSPFSSSFFQSSAPWQYQAQQQQQQFHSQQQLPSQHSSTFFKPPTQSSPLQQYPPPQAAQLLNQHYPTNYYQKQPFYQQSSQPKPLFTAASQPSAPAAAQQTQHKPLGQIHQQLEPQSQYYVNHNQLYQPQSQHQQPSQHQQHSSIQHNQYYNAPLHKPTQSPKSSVIFPTPSPKSHQELPARRAPQPYQPIKFRPTPATAPQHGKSTPIAAKLENTQYSPKPYLFQKQPQFIQHPTFTIPVPTQQTYKAQIQQQHQQQPQAQQYQQYQTQTSAQHPYQTQSHRETEQQQQQHSQTSNEASNKSVYYTHNKNHQELEQQQQQQQQLEQQHRQTHQQQQNQQQHQQQQHQKQQQNQQQQHQKQHQNQQEQHQTQVQQNNRYQSHSSNQQSSAALPHTDLNWLDIKPSKETELLKSIPKFEQHITETVQNQYNPHQQYQTQNQVIHDVPAPNLGSQQLQNQPLHGHYIAAPSYNSQTYPQLSQQQTFTNFVTASSNLQHAQQIDSTTQTAQFGEATDGQKIMIVTPMPPNIYEQYQTAHSYQGAQGSGSNQQHSTQIINSVQPSQEQYNNYYQQPRQGQSATQAQTFGSAINSPYSVSNYHSDVFKELEQRNTQPKDSQTGYEQHSPSTTPSTTTTAAPSTTVNPKTLLQLPDEVPDDLRQQLLSSGILGNADISVLDYDKVGETALENLPAEHLQHFYGAGGGAQISASKKVLTVLKPNGDKVSLDEKEIDKVKQTGTVPHHKKTDVKIVRYEGEKSEKSENSETTSTSDERQYNRYLPLKINGANFPKPAVEELQNKYLQSIVVLAPVDTPTDQDAATLEDSKEVKFLGGDFIKTLVKKPTKENFKRWLDKEARTDIELQSVVLLVAKSSNSSEQEIFMYDITTGEINKLNGELSSKFVSVAEENASTEDLEHGATLDPNFMETVMQQPSSS